jgi:acetyltransferase
MMSMENLDKIFRPKSIAVVGASEKEPSIGSTLMRNLIDGGFAGEIYPINPNHTKIWQRPAYPSIKDLESPVDLVVISIPITAAVQVVKDCAGAGAGGVIIISAGGKEVGQKGRNLEAAIRQEALRTGLRIIGPNCAGIMSSRSKLNASFTNQMPLPGKMAFISQSGALCTAILDLAVTENIGFSHFVSLGDMLDVDFGDMIDYLGS